MKYIIHIGFGPFRMPKEIADKFGCDAIGDSCDYGDNIRTNSDLISWVESHPNNSLAIVDIPDNATDWKVIDCDGSESVIAVVDGKLLMGN